MDSSEEDQIIMALANEDDSKDYEMKPRKRSSSLSKENKRRRRHRQRGTSSSSSSALTSSNSSSRVHTKMSKSTKRVKTSKSKKSKGDRIRSGEKTLKNKDDAAGGYTPSRRRNRSSNATPSTKDRNNTLSKHGNSTNDKKRKRISNSQRVSSSKGVSRERKKVDTTNKTSSKKQPNSTWNDEKEHESTIEIIRKVREQANMNTNQASAIGETVTVGNTDVAEKKEEKGDNSTTATTTTTNTVKHSMEQLQNDTTDANISTATNPSIIEKEESAQSNPMKAQPPRISTTTVDGTTTTRVIPTTYKSTATASITTISVDISPSKSATATPVPTVNAATATTTTHQLQTKQQQQQQAPQTTMSMTTPWARKFILSRPKDALLPIPREFLSDGFNLVQLGPIVEKAVQAMNLQRKESSTIQEKENQSPLSNLSLYKSALKLILEEADSTEDTSIAYNHAIYSSTQIQKAAEVLYSLVHARYVSSPRGSDTIRRMFLRNAKMSVQKKFNNENSVSASTHNTEIGAIFGRCSRIQCKGTPFLPIGLSDRYDIGETEGQKRKAMRLCPCCRETFVMWDSRVDGAAWGTSFAYLFLMTQGSNVFGKHYGQIPGERDISHSNSNDRIFGFPIHAAAAINASN